MLRIRRHNSLHPLAGYSTETKLGNQAGLSHSTVIKRNVSESLEVMFSQAEMAEHASLRAWLYPATLRFGWVRFQFFICLFWILICCLPILSCCLFHFCQSF